MRPFNPIPAALPLSRGGCVDVDGLNDNLLALHVVSAYPPEFPDESAASVGLVRFYNALKVMCTRSRHWSVGVYW